MYSNVTIDGLEVISPKDIELPIIKDVQNLSKPHLTSKVYREAKINMTIHGVEIV